VGSQTETLSDVLAEAIETLTSFSVPLYVELRSRPVLCGTGFFVNVAKECFLVTAAHVLDDAKSHRMYFHATPKLQRALDGRMVRSGSQDRRLEDIVDIGIVRLGPRGRPPFPEVGKFAMSLDYLAPSRLPRAKRNYAIIGYPETKNRFRPNRLSKSMSSISSRCFRLLQHIMPYGLPIAA